MAVIMWQMCVFLISFLYIKFRNCNVISKFGVKSIKTKPKDVNLHHLVGLLWPKNVANVKIPLNIAALK